MRPVRDDFTEQNDLIPGGLTPAQTNAFNTLKAKLDTYLQACMACP